MLNLTRISLPPFVYVCVLHAAIEFVKALPSLELLWLNVDWYVNIKGLIFKISKEKGKILLIGHHNARVVFIKEQL